MTTPSPFLGMPVTKLMSTAGNQESLAAKVVNLLERVDASPITTKQKITLYKNGICPRLAWSFRVLELPITWIERELESKATKFLKKRMSISQGGNSKILYLLREDGRMALPALSTYYKQQQVSRHILFSTSSDDCICFLEAKQADFLSKGNFSPSRVVNSIHAVSESLEYQTTTENQSETNSLRV